MELQYDGQRGGSEDVAADGASLRKHINQQDYTIPDPSV
jgi:hypothetical protein